jgi:hypothetical protein
MIPASLPFEYLHHFHRHDRVRRIGSRPMGSPVRRGMPVGRANRSAFKESRQASSRAHVTAAETLGL